MATDVDSSNIANLSFIIITITDCSDFNTPEDCRCLYFTRQRLFKTFICSFTSIKLQFGAPIKKILNYTTNPDHRLLVKLLLHKDRDKLKTQFIVRTLTRSSSTKTQNWRRSASYQLRLLPPFGRRNPRAPYVSGTVKAASLATSPTPSKTACSFSPVPTVSACSHQTTVITIVIIRSTFNICMWFFLPFL